MLLYLAVALVVGATTSTAYINPMEDYRGIVSIIWEGYGVSISAI